MSLNEKLNRIKEIFPKDLIDKFLSEEITNEEIQEYYRVNKLAYTMLHSNSNFIHMAISRNGIYKEEDLLEPVKLVEKYIKEIKAKNVLELATGRGANTNYLSKIFPDTQFAGIDLSDIQLSFANKSRYDNATFTKQDYHDLSRIEGLFDIAFIVEALCYSNQKEIVFQQVFKKLNKNGLFIIFDGYLNKPLRKLTEIEKTAKKMVERGMAVRDIEEYELLKKQARVTGFKLDFEENVSNYIMPNLYRFERLSKVFFANVAFAKLLSKILPFDFVKNTVTAYLLPELMKSNISNYMITVFRKA